MPAGLRSGSERLGKEQNRVIGRAREPPGLKPMVQGLLSLKAGGKTAREPFAAPSAGPFLGGIGTNDGRPLAPQALFDLFVVNSQSNHHSCLQTVAFLHFAVNSSSFASAELIPTLYGAQGPKVEPA